MRTALILACLAGGWALVSNDWFSARASSVGLFGVEMCADYCRLETWRTLKAPMELFVLGGLTGAGIIKLIVFAVHALLVKDKARVKVRWTIATAAITLALAAVFVVRAPQRLPGMPLSLGYAPFLAVTAIIAIAVLVRATRIR
jgi:hypothetical protein